MMMDDDDEQNYAENEFQVGKEHVNYNKKQQGTLLKHSQTVHFCPREYNQEFEKHLNGEYNMKSEHSRQLFGNHEMNTIRWRHNKEGKIESNAKIVQWDDGTMHLMVGDQMFNLQTKDFSGEACTFYERPPEVNQNSIQKMANIQKTAFQ